MEQNHGTAGDAPSPAPTPPPTHAQSPVPAQTPGDLEDFWDRRYAEAESLWSGQPNGTLVHEAGGLQPGRALDVGCGEGADALWLAGRGWDVTALDVSGVALARAAREAGARGLRVEWLHSGLVEAALPPASFDLVSAQYPALLRTPENVAERALLDAVAPGGLLLAVHHQLPTAAEASARGIDLDEYVGLADIRALLDGNWRIEVDEVRPRNVAAGAGAHHTEDVVLKARRLR